jgi:diguanylate cyclase (GGDEF)-like protein
MGRGFTMLMLDLDDLKPVNDTFGHQWGDRLLKAIADTVRRTVRFTDAAARYGGDEFVVLLPETDAAGGYVVGEKLRRDISSLTLHAADRNVRSSVSVGLVAYPDDGSTIEQLVAAADVAMYEAKRRGKNRIVGYQTRTERVATDIDADTNELIVLTPGDDVRTGGDPAPWGAAAPEGGARVSYGEHGDYPVSETPLEPPERRRSDRSTIRVEPQSPDTAPWWTEPAPEPRAQPPEPRERPQRPSEPRERPERPPEPRERPERPPARPTDEPPEPPRRTRTAVDAPEQPWLTRSDTAAEDPPQSGVVYSDDLPPQRPTPDRRSGGGSRSRSDELRDDDDDRPWIALPIEPDEPTEPPRR